jgi:predicted nucleic acid-binding protein
LSAYADTSLLVSLYVFDSNSARAAAQIKRVNLPVWLTAFGEIELTNAFHLRIFRRELRLAQVRVAQALFRKDMEGGVFELRNLTPQVFERAKLIAQKHTPRLGTRTLDLLHVASALELEADTFLTFDHRQNELAKAEGLRVP